MNNSRKLKNREKNENKVLGKKARLCSRLAALRRF